eukprot:403336668
MEYDRDQKLLLNIVKKFPSAFSEQDLLGEKELFYQQSQDDMNDTQESGHKSVFGFTKAFFTELFLPKETQFQNTLFDLVKMNMDSNNDIVSVNQSSSTSKDNKQQQPNFKAFAFAKEQIRDGFIGKQSYKIFRLRQQMKENSKNLLENEKDHLRRKIIKESILAQHLRDIFESFYLKKTTTIHVNNWMKFSLNQSPSYNQIQSQINERSQKNGLAFSEIVKVVQHLIFWNQAKIIYPINLKQIYVLNSEISIANQETAQKFYTKFNHLKITFAQVLNMFSLPHKLQTLYQTLSMTLRDFINILIFLLQHKVIEERNIYIVMKLPSKHQNLKELQKQFFETAYENLLVNNKRSNSQSVNKGRRGSLQDISPQRNLAQQSFQNQDNANSNNNQHKLTKKQSQITIEDYIELIRDNNSYEFKLLEKIYPFLNGEFNHYDIMMITLFFNYNISFQNLESNINMDEKNMSLEDLIKRDRGNKRGRGAMRGGRGGNRGGLARGGAQGLRRQSGGNDRFRRGGMNRGGDRRLERGGNRNLQRGNRGGRNDVQRDRPFIRKPIRQPIQASRIPRGVIEGGRRIRRPLGVARGLGQRKMIPNIGRAGEGPLKITKKIDLTPKALRKLKVRNIDEKQVTNEDLKVQSSIIKLILLQRLFEKLGTLKECKFDRNNFGQFLGSATVVYDKPEDAQEAIQQYHGAQLDDRILTVEFDRPVIVPKVRANNAIGKGKTLRVGGRR